MTVFHKKQNVTGHLLQLSVIHKRTLRTSSNATASRGTVVASWAGGTVGLLVCQCVGSRCAVDGDTCSSRTVGASRAGTTSGICSGGAGGVGSTRTEEAGVTDPCGVLQTRHIAVIPRATLLALGLSLQHGLVVEGARWAWCGVLGLCSTVMAHRARPSITSCRASGGFIIRPTSTEVASSAGTGDGRQVGHITVESSRTLSALCDIGQPCAGIKCPSRAHLPDVTCTLGAEETYGAGLRVRSRGTVFTSRTDLTDRVLGGVCVVSWVTRNGCGGPLWTVVTHRTFVTCHSISGCGCSGIACTVVLSRTVPLWSHHSVIWTKHSWSASCTL